MISSRRFSLAGVAVLLAGCGATHVATPEKITPRDQLVSVGKPLVPRSVEVMGIPGTLELSVKDPARPTLPPVLVTLGRAVQREPRDVCFGSYVANQSPADGDVGCQVRGSEPLVLTLGYGFIPNSRPLARLTTMWGQVRRGVNVVQLVGPGAVRRSVPLSTHRMFLVAFSPFARGAVQLRLKLADGTWFTHAFTLPLTHGEAGSWPRTRRRGAVFNYGIGENIVQKSYRQLIAQLGPPLKTFPKPRGVRCIYYDIVGYETGWTFCFKGRQMVGAAGNQAAPAGAQ
jgi:hypothetical protein